MADLPDWYAASVLTGWNGTQHRTLKVLETGELYAMLKCKYDALIKDVKGDIAGNLTLNVKAQDLAEIVNRPKYGGALQKEDTVELTTEEENTFVTVEGKGMIYGGFIMSLDSNIIDTDSPRIYVDDQPISKWSWDSLKRYGLTEPNASIISLSSYDIISPVYTAVIRYGITFERNVSLRYWCVTDTSRYLTYSLLYAVI